MTRFFWWDQLRSAPESGPDRNPVSSAAGYLDQVWKDTDPRGLDTDGGWGPVVGPGVERGRWRR